MNNTMRVNKIHARQDLIKYILNSNDNHLLIIKQKALAAVTLNKALFNAIPCKNHNAHEIAVTASRNGIIEKQSQMHTAALPSNTQLIIGNN